MIKPGFNYGFNFKTNFCIKTTICEYTIIFMATWLTNFINKESQTNLIRLEIVYNVSDRK